MKRSLSPIFIAAFVLACLAPAHAVTLVQWGQSTTIVSVTRTSTTVGNGTTISFTTPANPTIQSTNPDYYGVNTGRSPLFYSVTNDDVNTTASQLQIINDYDPDTAGPADARDTLRFNLDAGAAVAHVSYGLALWRRYGNGTTSSPNFGFLNGGDNSANTVTLQSLSATANTNSNNGTTENRFVIQLGTSYYISSDIGDFPAGSGGWGSLSIPDVTAASWFNYDPTSDFRVVGSAAAIGNFSDLAAVGIFYTRSTSLRFANISYSDFQATGTVVVPEPSSAALALLGILAPFAARRRRH